MPNWCFGEMYVSGCYENVTNFFRNGVQDLESEEEDEFGNTTFSYKRNDGFTYIKGTDRCFVSSQVSVGPAGDDIQCETDIECAWDLDTEGFTEVSRIYGVRIEIHGEEPNMGFTHNLICENGEIVEDVSGDIDEEWRE